MQSANKVQGPKYVHFPEWQEPSNDMESKEHVHMHQQGSNVPGPFLQIARHMLSNGHSSHVGSSWPRDLNP